MSNLIPGNQKHLTQEDRVFIENSLNQSMPFKEIAKYLCKDPSTISKEVRKHRSFRERNSFNSPNQCAKRGTCRLRNVCGRPDPCKKECRGCAACNGRCGQFEKESCPTVLKAPHVCNGCHGKAQCRMEKYFYKALAADRQYRTILSESRTGLNITEGALAELDDLVTPLVNKGQSLYQILESHPEIGRSVKTLYNYVESGALSTRNIDLRRKVGYKPRKQRREPPKDTGMYKGRTYADFQELVARHPGTEVVEMDTVVGCAGSRKVLLTMYFRNSKCLLIRTLPDRTAASVGKVFGTLEKRLTTPGFCRAFPAILTDRGTEFSDPDSLEAGSGGIVRTSIYYCDPMASWQKPGIEKGHEYIRYVLPKGTSFDSLTQWDANRLASHINSTPRASLGGNTPYRMALLLLGPDAVMAFGLREIGPDDVTLTPSLLK